MSALCVDLCGSDSLKVREPGLYTAGYLGLSGRVCSRPPVLVTTYRAYSFGSIGSRGR